MQLKSFEIVGETRYLVQCRIVFFLAENVSTKIGRHWNSSSGIISSILSTVQNKEKGEDRKSVIYRVPGRFAI